LGIFIIEIALHLFAFHCLYLEDMWNIFDLVVIILSIIFVVLDIYVENKVVESILKIRGIFRLLRIFILVRKLNTLKIRRDLIKKKITSLGYDLTSPLEKVIELLNVLRDQLDEAEEKAHESLNYIIKTI
jgi:hypothetical protein